jgi:peptidoglycan/xylan/chitin deacetylase (PgdA/CDA1 family)
MKNFLIKQFYKNLNIVSQKNPGCLILNYHGLIESYSDLRLERNFHLIKSFEEQIRFFNKKFKIISLQELSFKIDNNLPLEKSIIITFDDGYSNNILAREILDKINPNISFSIFISTGSIDKFDESIWTVNLSLLLLKGNINTILFEGQKLNFNDKYNRNIHFNFIRNRLKKLNAFDRNKEYNSILSQYENNELARLLNQFPQFKILSWDYCRKLSQNNTDIESHGVNHELLHAHQNIGVIESEIINSKETIKVKTGKYPIGFAYPNGNYSEAAINILKKNDYKLAFTTKDNIYNSLTSPMLINRLAPPNDMSSFYKKIASLKN